MANGVPVRLVRNDGKLIELLCTDISLDVERKTGGIALPFSGSSRVGFDFNMNNSVIVLNGIISDDDIIYTTSSNKGAISDIDFSVTQISVEKLDASVSWGSTGIINGILENTTDETDASHAIRLTSTDGSIKDVYLAKTATAHGSTAGRDFISVHDGVSPRTESAIATNLHNLINDAAFSLFILFSSTLETSDITNNANTKVVITQKNKGVDSNTSSPAFTTGVWPSGYPKPKHRKFRGGAESVSKSAGDKVMDLYGTLNNSNNGGGGQILSTAVVNMAIPFSGNVVGGIVNNYLDPLYGDYIIGIQIPFNSTVNASNGEKYTPVNFFMPTGGFHKANTKDSSNAKAAGTEFDSKSPDYTGIKGTVQKATFTQMGGEPIYGFTIIFAPIDYIM